MTTDADPPVAAWRRARTGAAVLAAAVVASIGLLWWFQPWNEVAARGEVAVLDDLPGGPAGPVDREIPVGTPDGGLTVRVARPTARLERIDLSEQPVVGLGDAVVAGEVSEDGRHAPRTWDYLPLAWTAYADLDLGIRETGSGPPTTSLRVLAGDAVVVGPFDLGDRLTDPGAVAVLVQDPAEVTIEVTFDGHTQVVHPTTGRLEAGVAEAYADDAAATGVPVTDAGCRLADDLPPDLTLGGDEEACSGASVRSGPWAPGVGWVPEAGQRWVAVDVEVLLATTLERGSDSSRRRYDSTGGRPEVRLGGRLPDAGTARRPRHGQPGAVVGGLWLVDTEDPLERVVGVPLRLVPLGRGGDRRVERGEVTATEEVDPVG